MSSRFELSNPLRGANFGGLLRLPGEADAHRFVQAAESEPEVLPHALAASDGLLVLQGMEAMAKEPSLLVRLSRIFGPEVENYRETLTPLNMVHETVPEIFIVSNTPPVGRQPPRLPEPRLTEDGGLPTRFPHRRGWHTDQSYRRPPPDISLFLAVIPVPKDQGQTLFANGTAAYEALSPALKARVDGLEGLHVGMSAKRSRDAVLAGEPPLTLPPHQRPQRQPVVRVHPVTGRRALYLCEFGQMDWLEGPFVGMEPGPNGDGAELLLELMSHLTRPEFIYVHEWTPGDILVWDNRCLVHAATWFDAANETRLMWRTTVSGNPGAAYSGETKSWIAA
ncbi:MAG: TauD/TfdA family dioxygenase [Acetobacteraceae bacterium]